MKLSADSHSEIQQFFRHHFADDNLILPNFHVHCGYWARKFTSLFKIHGITLGRHVIIDSAFVTRENGKQIANSGLIVHEATHVLQYKHEGFFGFLYKYLREWLAFMRSEGKRDKETRWQAYYAIGHEAEARLAAEKYIQWKMEN